ncbi:MAG: hypothetical protein GY899_09620 [Verrucomicrobiaceae bacterium]|nr:hypothetical protein [Verrucomicrobiaceae bacterium]
MDKLTKGALLATIGLLVIVTLYLGKGWLAGRADKLKADQENANLRQQVIEERNQLSADTLKMREDLDRLQSESDAKLAAEIESLRKEVSVNRAESDADLSALKAEKQALLESVRKEKEEELTAEQRKITEAPAIAKIEAVDPGKGFVIINAGSAQGIESGVRFNIRRDKFIVGEIEITKVIDEGKSIADIDGAKIPQGLSLRQGDDVVSHPIY